MDSRDEAKGLRQGRARPSQRQDTIADDAGAHAFAATDARRSSKNLPIISGLQPGDRIHQYELLRELGRGGMGVVYLARDTRLGRRVAIKFLVSQSRRLIDGFLREARATARCHHENIVVIHEADEHDGLPYMVLEYLEGQTLRRVITGEKLSPQRAVELMVPVARALVCAHRLNIVHRDLKPDNVFVTTTGTLKVLDFGIAALFEDSAAETRGESDRDLSATHESAVAGTLPYMAPEQFQKGVVDQRSDLWAFGIILFEMLTGHHPVQPLNGQTLLRNAIFVDEPMPRLDGEESLPHRLVHLVDRCLQKRKEQRIATAQEVLEELESLLPARIRRNSDEEVAPYPGLAAFQEADADRFVGRGRDVLQILTRLREYPLAAVVGPSGIGKSSFVRAGVMPALKASGETWEALVLRPGRQPLQSVATVLLSFSTEPLSVQAKMAEHEELVARLREEPGYMGALLRSRATQRREKILLFVDQFEELYTLVPDETERRAFVACLSGVADDAAAPLRVLVSMRSDFLDRVGEDRRFAEELTRSLLFLPPLGREALKEALKTPVAQLGYGFETPGMIEEMVEALAATPGALPLLQFAGTKLWEARDVRRKVLTLESYRRMGGISGVLAQHADQVVQALPATSQKLVRALFRRLVTADGTRAIVEVAELADLSSEADELRRLIDQLVQARLLVSQSGNDQAATTIELVHESLITGWPTLRRWLDEGREDIAFREQLRTIARQWDARGRPQGLLWTGDALEEARLWRARHVDVLPPKEQEYLSAVLALGSRAQQRRRMLALGTIVALSLIIAGGAIALVRVRQAERRAVDQAGRAVLAESKVRAQLDLLRTEEEERSRAETEVKRGKEDLRVVNGELKKALQTAESESKRARAAAEDAHRLADSVQKSNARLEKLLAEERARAEQLARQRRKISTDLQ
jgi:hypothetical protein